MNERYQELVELPRTAALGVTRTQTRPPFAFATVGERGRVESAQHIPAHAFVVLDDERELRCESGVRAGVDVAEQVAVGDEARRVAAAVSGANADVVDGRKVALAVRPDQTHGRLN